MGQRANFIIVQYGKYELFYSHWAANTLTSDLFWSPEYATAFIRMQREVDKTGWLDDVWAEGGAVVDWDNKVFLLFGGENLLWDVPLRRMYLQMLSCVWKDWTIKWAYEGIADIADYVSYPRSKVLSKFQDEDSSYEYNLASPEEKSWTDVVGSVIFHDGSIGLFPLSADIEFLLMSGLQLASKVENQRQFTLDELFLDEWIEEFLWGGFHLDFTTKTLEFWIASETADIVNRIEPYWSGWNIIFHRDCFEFQEERTKGKLRFPQPSHQTLRKNIEEILLREEYKSPVEGLLELSQRDRQEGKEVEINPWALRDDRLELNIDRQKEILGCAFAKLFH